MSSADTNKLSMSLTYQSKYLMAKKKEDKEEKKKKEK
jgi:hypothetical protein